jgi:hypothetical protein
MIESAVAGVVVRAMEGLEWAGQMTDIDCVREIEMFRSILFAAFVLVSASCSSPTTPDVPQGAVRVDGTVQFYSFEGGFWAIRGDDGVTYDPLNGLSSAFQRENLRVSVVLTIRNDVGGTHMAGPLVEIISIVAR